ncbi:MAG: cytochrome c biogenesis protein CcdA [Coriobacteriia bacterium]|nr:cytochrome c biogenesis protein CcdA [Coriobacteriia bacterium]
MSTIADLAYTFWLGVLTPTTALCVIPLYPAFLARLARTVGERHDSRRYLALFGVLVSLGVIAFMAIVGLVFTFWLQESLTRVIGIVSPVAFAIMVIAGIVLIAGWKPKRKVRPNKISNPYLAALAYGFFFGAIVIPCNPAIIAVFFARVATAGDFAANIAQFSAYTLGIVSPLLAFSLVGRATSRTMINFLVDHERAIGMVAGVVMVGVGIYYLVEVFAVFG